ncbi:MAG TPA: diacylglycerol kinase family protein [Longimicrobium sp.]|nr:diacylglycerol kinase family protein [Longimicrobium sp.]
MPSDFYVVLNPVAGRGDATLAWDAVRRELEAAGARYEVARTRARGDGARLAEAAARAGWSAVLAVGGDGTVHEVANGLLRAAADGEATVPMGIIAVGSGNDFAGLAGVPRDPAEAMRRAISATPRAVDAGRVGDEWFTNGVGVGLDARVAIEASRNRRFKGMAIYLWALAKVLRRFRPPRMLVEMDDLEPIDRPLTLVTVGNGGRHGGGFWICPDASIDDGLLDVCVCDSLSVPRILRFLPKTIRGTHVGESCVHMHRVRRVRITSEEGLPVHADGEILFEDARELVFEIHPGRLTLLL